jgi:hypothetical protein
MEQPVQLEDTREAVALFSDQDSLQAAIDELLTSGFDRAELSLLGTEDSLRSAFGNRFKTSAELEDVEGVPRTCYCSVESLGDAQGGVIGGLVYVGAVATTAMVAAAGLSLYALIFGAPRRSARRASVRRRKIPADLDRKGVAVEPPRDPRTATLRPTRRWSSPSRRTPTRERWPS